MVSTGEASELPATASGLSTAAATEMTHRPLIAPPVVDRGAPTRYGVMISRVPLTTNMMRCVESLGMCPSTFHAEIGTPGDG